MVAEERGQEERVFDLLVGEIRVPELLEAVPVRGLAGVFPEHEAVGFQADRGRSHNLVSLTVLEHTVLVDPRLVGKSVGSHDGLVGLDRDPGEVGY